LLPAVAVFTTSDGLPTKAIWLIAVTWKVTTCVLVWADTARVAPARRATVARMRPAFMSISERGVNYACKLSPVGLQNSVAAMTLL
jgi:hypothetical protein